MENFSPIVVKNETNYGIVTGTLICFLGFIFMFLTICYGLYEDPGKSDSSLIIVLAVMLLWGFGMLNKLLWQLQGKETISIQNGYLRLEKTGGFFKRYRKYDLNFIDSFYIKDNFRPKWWYTGNRIIKIGFTYLGDARSLSYPLTVRDANRYISDVNRVLRTK